MTIKQNYYYYGLFIFQNICAFIPFAENAVVVSFLKGLGEGPAFKDQIITKVR